jgi:hypothetical protein
MNRSSMNGDGKSRPPNDRISADAGSNKPVRPSNPDNQREQQIIDALKGRYDEIEALWKQAEEDLKRFRIPHAVEHFYLSDYDHGWPEHHVLCWMRYGKAWRIVHETRTAYSEVVDNRPDECEWKPITECPLDLRLAMIAEFENLRRKVVEAAEQAVPTLDNAISSFHKILKS